MSKTTGAAAFKRLTAVMKDIDGDAKQIVKGMQNQVAYLAENAGFTRKSQYSENFSRI